MNDQTLQNQKVEPVGDENEEFIPKYFNKDFKTPEAFIRMAEEMKTFLTINPLPEELSKRKHKA